MVFQRDKGVPQESFQTGLPPAHSGDDVPRWLVILGLAAGLMLVVALLRYAIDLLGVVFVIILVGFAIRALSDWLTEGQAVSVWALSALSMGLIGTVLVGLWLFNSGDMGSQAIQNRLPGVIQGTVVWLETKGWGQRVLLSGSSASDTLGGGAGQDVGASSRDDGPAADTSVPAEPVAMPAPSRPAPALPASGAATVASRSRAASARQSQPAQAPAPPAAVPPSAVPPAAVPPASLVQVATTVTLSTSPARPVVGSSVRLTAYVRDQGGDTAPSGTVVFTADEQALGHAQVHGGVATLVTLDLGIGDHTLSAAYQGDGTHLPSRSASISQTVARK